MNKTEQMLLYLIRNGQAISVTSLIKLAYLCDLVSIKRTGQKISDFDYIRYYYGPFDKKVYDYLASLLENGSISSVLRYSPSGDEYYVYSCPENFALSESQNLSDPALSKDDFVVMDDVLEEFGGYGPKILTEVAYKTAPMKRLGATLGGNEHLNERLDLSLQ